MSTLQGPVMNSHRPLLDVRPSAEHGAILPRLQDFAGGPRMASACASDAAATPDAALVASQLWQQAVHDLRGQLGVVSAVTALLQQPRTDAKRLGLLAVLDRNVAAMRDLLNGVADLARLEAQRERPVISDVDVGAVLRDMRDKLCDLAGSRGLALDISGPAGLMAQSDPMMLRRIAQNLVINAIQYTRASAVTITYGQCDASGPGYWYFDVGDARQGWRTADVLGGTEAPLARPASAAGEGIGLHIVARLCSLLGGELIFDTLQRTGRITRLVMPRRQFGIVEPPTASSSGGMCGGHSGMRTPRRANVETRPGSPCRT